MFQHRRKAAHYASTDTFLYARILYSKRPVLRERVELPRRFRRRVLGAVCLPFQPPEQNERRVANYTTSAEAKDGHRTRIASLCTWEESNLHACYGN